MTLAVHERAPLSSAERWRAVRALHRGRPRSRFVRASCWMLAGLALCAWLSGEIEMGTLLEARRWDNLTRFLRRDLLPYPLRGDAASPIALWQWCWELVRERGAQALAVTLQIAVLAICLAQLAAAATAVLGADSLMRQDPYLSSSARRGLWWAVPAATRLGWILLRALPEYVWAFMLLAVIGPSVWPAVIALAIHNAGILGRLDAETIENLDRAPLASLRALGATRRQIAVHAALPIALPRALLYFFYRFESCVREATVLGMIGVLSLGYWVQDARARQLYDEMALWILLSALLVLGADLLSSIVRRWIRAG